MNHENKKAIKRFEGDKYRFLSNFYIKSVTGENLKPKKAKELGKNEPGLPSDWNSRAYSIMFDILKEKFSDEDLKDKLLATGDTYLEEGNRWHDNRWGNCNCKNCKNIEGKNWLGKILMQIRDEIKEIDNNKIF